jgi:hypothetical protein
MKKIIFTFFVLLCCHSSSGAQQFFTLGLGFGGAFYHSQELDQFKNSYNLLYRPHLIQGLQALKQAFGWEWEIGYRRLERLGLALLAGMQNYTSHDLAQFENRETRKLDLKLNSFYIGGEVGHSHKNIFVNGVCTVFFNRKLTLKSTYSNPLNEDIPNKSLNGNYKGDASVSTDLGMALGYFKDPLLLVVKITYPVFTTGGSSVLHDNKSEKVAEGTNIFPDQYDAFLYRQPYQGVASNIDGLKISLVVAFLIPLKS